ncbi:MAG: hypothetical protein RL022_3144, partial [Chloroflexota bacterium]
MTARRRFDVVFAETIAKHGGSPGDAEDVSARSGDGRCVAVCDGASVSFDPRTWATVLAQAFAADPPAEPSGLPGAWIVGVAARYRADAERDDWSWAQEEAYRLGSVSTLLGVRACTGTTACTSSRSATRWPCSSTVTVGVDRSRT